LAEISALADGTLAPGSRPAVEARIAASPELSAIYQRERRVVDEIRRASVSERAPARLRARIEAQRPSARVSARRRLSYGGALAGSLAAIALALVLILPAGTPGGPSVSQAAALASLGPTGPAPVADPSAPGVKLGRRLQDVYFPNWSSQFGWRAVGQRADVVDGRPAVTVYYDWHGRRVAYTIVGAPALATPASRVTHLNGTELRTLDLGGRLVVTWRRAGHTCVLSASAVPAAELQKLAAWKVPGSGRDGH
jgi:anti-sigma factor RsiW